MNEKIENVLNVAMDISVQERERSESLSAGFDTVTQTWDIIVRYVNDLDFLEQYEDVGVNILSNNFAIITTPESLIDTIAQHPNIIYVEKPKPLYFQVLENRRDGCIASTQNRFGLYGEGVLIAIIDSGIDYAHMAFRDMFGNTRIAQLWDQSDSTGIPPVGFTQGSVYTREQINEALQRRENGEAASGILEQDRSGHGTHVAGIAGGNFAENKINQVGIATQAEFLIVKLKEAGSRSFATTVELMEGIDYVVQVAQQMQKPLVINLSFGNNYGSHDGTSLVETYIDEIAAKEQISIVIGSGNEGNAGGHTSGIVEQGMAQNIDIAVSQYQSAFSIQLWKSYADIFEIEVIAPDGAKTGIFTDMNQVMAYQFPRARTELFVYYGTPKPYSIYQEVYMELSPMDFFVEAGIWKVRIVPRKVEIGLYHMWLPVENALGTSTRFRYPTADVTLTIPSTARNAITVGAYDSRRDTYADFSGRGFTRETNQVKPEMVAPGVNILSAAVGGGVVANSGTSVAAPFVTGAVALLMEWGIVRRNDSYLYGQKAKAYLIRGARQLAGEVTPSPRTGYGALCLLDSLPL